MSRLIWLRSDLRLTDNPALHYAFEDSKNDCAEGLVDSTNSAPVAALFVLCQEYIDTHPIGPRKLRFINDALVSLSTALASCAVELNVLYVESKEDVAGRVLQFCLEREIKAVYANREYPLDERRRDKRFEALSKDNGIEFNAYHDRCLIPPGALKTQAGDYYKVFTPFSRAWRDLAESTNFIVYPKPFSESASIDAALEKKSHSNIAAVFKTVEIHAGELEWPAREDAAIDALQVFIRDDIDQYHECRDIPSRPGTSKLSPYLSIGLLSPKQCYIAAMQSLRVNKGSGSGLRESKGVDTWVGELIWREFYMHVVAIHPDISKHQPLQAYTRDIPWRNSERDFERWCNGTTGIPIVDAAMRQLNTTGWMHNRLRMVAAMFLTKNLRIDWRRGEAYFMRQLVDAEFCANNGGWQWCASTGTDAAPYFRVMNPVSQSQRFDPEGEFIRAWVPELKQLSNKEIHQPSDVSGYPEPMVDLKASRKEVIDIFKAVKDRYQEVVNEH